jgi:hypothetical protein
VAVLGFRDDRERVLRRWLARCQPLRLPETLGIAGHGGIAAPGALLLEEMKHLPGVMTALVPVLEEEGFVGVQDAVPTPFGWRSAPQRSGSGDTETRSFSQSAAAAQWPSRSSPDPVMPKSVRDARAGDSGCGRLGLARAVEGWREAPA